MKLMLNRSVLLFAILLTYCASAYAQTTYHIRAGATGANNGSDWANAYSSFPSTMRRGATYYVADGTYGGYTFDDAASGSTLITVKKATVADHGSNTGWNNTYGDGQAVFTGGLTFTTPYWVFSGQTRNENDWSDASAYGFHVRYTGTGTGVKLLRFNTSSSTGNIMVQYTGFSHAGGLGTSKSDGRDIVYSLGGRNNTMSRCLFYNAGRVHFLFRGCTGYVVEYSWVDKNESTSGEHGESASALNSPNCIFRHNVFRDIQGTGVLVFGENSPGWKIYGNVVDRWTSNSNGVFTCWTVENATNAEVYNNTIANSVHGRIGFGSASGWKTYNNLFINTPNVSFGGSNHAHDYNAASVNLNEANGQIITTSDFVGYSTGNFRLNKPTKAGMALGAEYASDMHGNKRGTDGVWDRGAYEFVSGGASTLPAITRHPTSKAITAGETAAFDVEATGTAPLSYQWQRNGENIAGATAASYSTPGTTLADNGATFRVRVSNAAGNVVSNAATLTVNPVGNAAPNVTITNPTAGQTFPAPASFTIDVNASDSDGSIARVEFFNGTTKLGEDVTAPFSWTGSDLPAGTYSLTAKATDNQGAAKVSDAVSVTVSVQAANLKVGDRVTVLTSPTLRVRATPALAGTVVGTQPVGAVGTIVSGPVVADGYTWWRIDYQNDPDGWTIQGNPSDTYLGPVTTPVEPPSPPSGLRIVQ